jgi:preprotein translocase subunit YajC
MTIGASGGGAAVLPIIILAFAALWLIVIRPQRRRQSQQQRMVSELHVGDEVLTAGGIYGTISRLDEDEVTVEIAPGTEVRVARRAIAGVISEPKPSQSVELDDPGDEKEDDDDRWRSAFDDEGSSGDTSNEEKHG